MKKKKRKMSIVILTILSMFGIGGYYSKDIVKFVNDNITNTISFNNPIKFKHSYNIDNLPKYSGEDYIVINNNEPLFDEKYINTKSFEKYSDLDSLGRTGLALANIGKDLMPTEERGSIGMIKPSGWHTVKYNNIDGKYLYNRCHLIGYQLSDEDSNKQNLITGTRYLNIEGMLPFENKVADYIKSNKSNHVLYRVTPIFKENNLVASGVQMEACSVEDNGQGICFNVYCYNVQPGIVIDYATGESQISTK